MEAVGSTPPPRPGSVAPPSVARLRLSSDGRLVGRIRDGSEEAFTTLWERYHRPLLSYCRQLLGSHHEAEEAVQQTFANAYRALRQGEERDLQLRPWLYRIARNQCFSMLRARKPAEELGDEEPSLVGLSEEVAGRAELRALLRDLAALPTEQREALVLAELHDNSHAQVAEILGCSQNKVKALVFQARSSLMKSREARELQCGEVQEQLSVLRGGSLRRAVLRRHLAECEACTLFAAEVKRQRAALAMVLPVVPTGVLKLGAATAFAAGTTAAATTATTAGVGATTAGVGATSAGTGAGLAAKLGVSASLLKGAAATLAVTTAAAGGVATTAKVAHEVTRDSRPASVEQAPPGAPPSSSAQPVNAGPAAPSGKDAAAGQPPVTPGEGKQQKPPGLAPGNGRRPDAAPPQPKLAKQPPTMGRPDVQKRPARPTEDGHPVRPLPTRKPHRRPVRARPHKEPRPERQSKPLEPEGEAPSEQPPATR